MLLVLLTTVWGFRSTASGITTCSFSPGGTVGTGMTPACFGAASTY
ncbi:hypothetical protein [Streptomyces atratus]